MPTHCVLLFPPEYVDGIRVCASSLPSLPLLLRALFLIIMMMTHDHRASF